MNSRNILIKALNIILEKGELSNNEREIFTRELSDQASLSLSLVLAAIYRRIETFNYLCQLRANPITFQQWVGGVEINNELIRVLDKPLPEFDLILDHAINSDNAELLISFCTISDEVKLYIISQLDALHIEIKLRLPNISESFPGINESIEQYSREKQDVEDFARAIVARRIEYIRANQSRFSSELQRYFVVLSASCQQTEMLRLLIEEKQFDSHSLKAWMEETFSVRPLTTKYKLTIPSSFSTVLSSLREEGDVEYIRNLLLYLNVAIPSLAISLSTKQLLTAVTHLDSVLKKITDRTEIKPDELEWVNWLLVNYPKLTKSLVQKVLDDDNLGLFCTFYDEEKARELSLIQKQALLVQAAKADAIDVFKHIYTSYGFLLDLSTRNRLYALVNDDAHPKLNDYLKQILSAPYVLDAPGIRLFEARERDSYSPSIFERVYR